MYNTWCTILDGGCTNSVMISHLLDNPPGTTGCPPRLPFTSRQSVLVVVGVYCLSQRHLTVHRIVPLQNPHDGTRHAVSGESRSGISGGVIPGPRTHRPAPLGRGARDIAGSDVGPSLVLVLGWACRVVGLGECRRQFVFVLFVVYDGLVVPGGFADSGVIGSSANSPDSPKTACYCVSRDVDMMFLRA